MNFQIILKIMMEENNNSPLFDSFWEEYDQNDIEKNFKSVVDDKSIIAKYRSQALTQLARIQGIQKNFSEAYATLEKSLKVSNDYITYIRYLLEKGRILRSSGIEGSDLLFIEAYKKSYNIDDYYAADATHMLAILHPNSGPSIDKTWSQLTLEIAKVSKNISTRRWEAIILNNIAWDAFDNNDFNKSLKLFQEAVLLRKQFMEIKNTKKSKEAYRLPDGVLHVLLER